MAFFVHAPLSFMPPFAVFSPLAALAADDVRTRPSPSPNTHALQAPSEAACSAAAGATRKRARASASGSGTRVSKPRAQKAAGLAAALLRMVVRRRPSSAWQVALAKKQKQRARQVCNEGQGAQWHKAASSAHNRC